MSKQWGDRARANDKQWAANRREARELRGKMNREIPDSLISKLLGQGRSDAQILREMERQGLRGSEKGKAARRIATARHRRDQGKK